MRIIFSAIHTEGDILLFPLVAAVDGDPRVVVGPQRVGDLLVVMGKGGDSIMHQKVIFELVDFAVL